MNIKQLDKGTLGEKNSVFIAFYVKPTYHYQTSEECRNWGKDCWNSKIALLGFGMRWDATCGFVGGKVDKGQTLVEAALREAKEEVGTELTEDKLTLICTHEMVDESTNFKQNTHVFLCELTSDEIYSIRNVNLANAEHGKVEVAGFNVVHMVEDAFDNLPKLVWAGTAQQEIELILSSGVLPKPEIECNGTW